MRSRNDSEECSKNVQATMLLLMMMMMMMVVVVVVVVVMVFLVVTRRRQVGATCVDNDASVVSKQR